MLSDARITGWPFPPTARIAVNRARVLRKASNWKTDREARAYAGWLRRKRANIVLSKMERK
jgi:hypothetical protein